MPVGGRAFCESVLAGVVLNARAGFWWLPAWFSAVRLASANPPAGTPDCMLRALAGWLIYTYAWWRLVEINKT